MSNKGDRAEGCDKGEEAVRLRDGEKGGKEEGSEGVIVNRTG